MDKTHLLVVDDDIQIGELLSSYLEERHYRVSLAHDGNEMRRMLKNTSVDLIILDIMLPNEDGLKLCQQLRQSPNTSDIPIIMLSAAGEEADRVLGLQIGADDYLTKPFKPRLLLAHIEALIRRTTGQLAQQRKSRQIAKMPNIYFKDWTLDQGKRRLISPTGVVVPLSAGEYELLVVFLENPQRTLNRDQLLDLTRGRTASPYDRTIDVQIARLRKKIENDPKNPEIILTMRGNGYQFNANVTTEAE